MDDADGLLIEESHPLPDPVPAAPVVEEPPVEAAPETPAEPVEPAPTPPEKPDPVQQRINQLTADRRQAENEAAYWRGQAEAKGPPPQAPMQPQQPQGEPQEGDFETFPAYAAALHKYHAKLALDTERADRAEQDARQAQVETMNAAQEAVRTREAAILTEHPDYYVWCEAVVQQIAPHVKWGIEMSGAHGPDLVLYLHDHPEAVQRLNQTPPHALGIELGMLRASGAGSPPARAAAPRAPKPEPPTPLPGGGRTTSPGFRDDQTGTQAQFEAEWKRTSRRP